MSDTPRAPQASLLRLSRYHCFVGELLRSEDADRLTSREMAEELGVSEETVRRDLSFVDVEGRPGAGYDPSVLYEALETFLGLSESFPYVAVATTDMLRALDVIFPAEQFGLEAVAYFSVRPGDAGVVVDGIEVRDASEIASAGRASGATVALVACEPDSVQDVLRSLDEGGIHAVLMLTPTLRPLHPDGMEVTYFRIPCALKALASATPHATPCCEASECAGRGKGRECPKG